MPVTIKIPGTDEVLGPLCGVGYGNAYAHKCLEGNLSLYIDGIGYATSTPHHRLQGDISICLQWGGGGTMYSHGNVSIHCTVPLTLCLGGEGEMTVKSPPHVMTGSTTDQYLRLGVCSDINTLTPVRIYCNDLSPLLPTIGNHLPEVEGYQNAGNTQCWQGMPGDGTRYYPHELGCEPPPSIWQSLQDVELRILQEKGINSAYGYHQVWLLADLWYKGQQVMYLRNGDAAAAPSRHILNRGALNALIVYLTRALGMTQSMYETPPMVTPEVNHDIDMVKQWGMRYTHNRY